jgi:hypothetical protein
LPVGIVSREDPGEAIGRMPAGNGPAYAAREMNTSDPDTAGDAAEWSLGRLLSMAARLVEQEWNSWLATGT